MMQYTFEDVDQMKHVQIMELDILTCSISGLRPPVELTLTTDNDSKVKLTNHRRGKTTDTESYLP